MDDIERLAATARTIRARGDAEIDPVLRVTYYDTARALRDQAEEMREAAEDAARETAP